MKIILFLLIISTTGCLTSKQRMYIELMSAQRNISTTPLVHSKENQDLRRKVTQKRIKDPYIWKITLKNKTSYLFGTMHSGISSNKLPINILAELKNSKTFVLESKGSEFLYSAPPKRLKKGSLKKTLPPEIWYQLRVDTMMPSFYLYDLTAGSALSVYKAVIEKRSLVHLDHDFLDRDLERLAKKEKLKVEYLETIEELKPILKELEKDNSKIIYPDELIDFIENKSDQYKKDTLKTSYDLLYAYKDGNLKALNAHTKNMTQLEKDVLLTKRNKLWLPKLIKVLEKGDAFIAVGVAHMPGKTGLLKLLKKEGFKIQRGLSH